jgi:hypothetical protein
VRIEAQRWRPLKRPTILNKKEVYLNIFRSLYAEAEDEAETRQAHQVQETR